MPTDVHVKLKERKKIGTLTSVGHRLGTDSQENVAT